MKIRDIVYLILAIVTLTGASFGAFFKFDGMVTSAVAEVEQKVQKVGDRLDFKIQSDYVDYLWKELRAAKKEAKANPNDEDALSDLEDVQKKYDEEKDKWKKMRDKIEDLNGDE